MTFLKKKQVVLISVAVIVFIAILAFSIKRIINNQTSTQQVSKPVPTTKLSPKPDILTTNQPVVKTGDEYIYQDDIDYYLDNYPAVDDKEELEKIIIDKLISDSVTIQAGQKESIINIPKEIFDTPLKDHQIRNNMVDEIKNKIDGSVDRIEGTIVSIWFYNTDPPPIGVEKAKQIAYEKITKLHNDVKNGIITIQEAGNRIKNDASLSDLDSNYKANAIMNFNSKKEEGITFDNKFDEVLWSLGEGEVSDIFISRDPTLFEGQEIEALYTFGQIHKKVVNNNTKDYQLWLEEQKKRYEIQYL